MTHEIVAPEPHSRGNRGQRLGIHSTLAASRAHDHRHRRDGRRRILDALNVMHFEQAFSLLRLRDYTSK